MRRELHYFDIYPKVVAANDISEVTIHFLERRFYPAEGALIDIQMVPLFHSNENMGDEDYDKVSGVFSNGYVKISYKFENEQEYAVRVYVSKHEYIKLSVYALSKDLFGLIPLKGDFHSHSTYSDGQESPEVVAAYYRKAGFDFMVLSDHSNYEGSLCARNFYKDTKADLCIVKGEEVHAPNNHVHIVNFGGEYSVNKLFEENEEEYTDQVNEMQKNLHQNAAVNMFECASCLWIKEKINAGGGIAIFAHPHWLVDGYHVRDNTSKWLFENNAFDAFELVGGMNQTENNMQISFFGSIHANMNINGGKKYPIVGSSDSHGVVLNDYDGSSLAGKDYKTHGFNEFKTIVFAKDNVTNEIVSAVKNGLSVAVTEYIGEQPQVHGDYRLVSYALFLMREYFPIHDELCFEEGRLMKDFSFGKNGAKEGIAALHGRVAELWSKYFQV